MIYDRANIFLQEMMAKTCPSCGYLETDNNALFCNKCGYPFPRNQPGRSVAAPAPGRRPAPVARREPRRVKSGAAGYLSFDTLITGNYLKLIYIFGAAGIILASLMGIVGMFGKTTSGIANRSIANISFTNTTALAQDPAGSPLFWIGFLIVGSVLWRMFCELFALVSRLHDADGYGNEAEPYDEPAEYGNEVYDESGEGVQGQMVECPKCRKIVPVEDLRECEHCGVQGCSNCIRVMGLLKKSMTCRECFEAK